MTIHMTSETLQIFELAEPKPSVCPVAVAVLAAAAGTDSNAAALHAWEVRLRDRSSGRRGPSVRPCLVASLILAAMATAPMACTTPTGERERYYAARAHVVEARPGDGALRLTVWPRTSDQRTTMAAAERTTDMP